MHCTGYGMINVRIGVKLLVGFIAVSFVSLCIGLYNMHNMHTLADDTALIGRISFPYSMNLSSLRSDFMRLRTTQRTSLIKDLPQDVVSAQKNIVAEVRKSYADSIAKIESMPLDIQEKAKIAELKKLIAEYDSINTQFLNALEVHDYDSMFDLAMKKGRDKSHQLDAYLSKMIAQQTELAGQASALADANVEKSAAWTLGLVCAGFMVSVGMGVFFTIAITRPLKKAVHMAQGIALGDISTRMQLRGQDELGLLARSLDKTADTLATLLQNINQVAQAASVGYLRRQVDDAQFAGDFRNLVKGINTWTGSMVELMDKIPTPITIRGHDRVIRFINDFGTLGIAPAASIEGIKCSDHFKADDCDNGHCACDRALLSHKDESSSTRACPLAGMELDIDYKATPFSAEAVCELVIDKTALMKSQRTITTLAVQADDIANRVAIAAEEISAQVEQCSGGAIEQTRRISETASAMHELNDAVGKVSQSAAEAAETADQARTKAESGAHMVAQVVEGISGVQTTATELKMDMTSLGVQADGIGKIMNVISDIADQTNLLALNAAIEAARAGDAGRGFAVVADEVRKLAEKTMTATREVGEAITGIQSGTQKNINNVDDVVSKIDAATSLASESGDSLGEIVRLVDMTTDQVRLIATAAGQQYAATEGISSSISDVNRISRETSVAMSQTSKSVSELSSQALTLKDMIGSMQSGG